MPYLGRRSTTGGKCRPSFSAFRPKAGRCCLPVLAVGFHGLGAALVLLFGRGGGATLRGVPRFKNSHGRRPSIHGEGEPPKVGEPRRGAPVADRFAALRFAQAVCFPQFLPLQLLENYF